MSLWVRFKLPKRRETKVWSSQRGLLRGKGSKRVVSKYRLWVRGLRKIMGNFSKFRGPRSSLIGDSESSKKTKKRNRFKGALGSKLKRPKSISLRKLRSLRRNLTWGKAETYRRFVRLKCTKTSWLRCIRTSSTSKRSTKATKISLEVKGLPTENSRR